MTATSLVEEAAIAADSVEWEDWKNQRGLKLAQAEAIIAVVLRRMEEPSKEMLAATVAPLKNGFAECEDIWAVMLAAFRKENGIE